MSGITGWLNYNGFDGDSVKIFGGMSNAIYKRGFYSVFYNDKSIMLSQRQDNYVEAPYYFRNEGKEYTVVFGGKIFNYEEIKKELTSYGFVFLSNSDEELILKAYVKWGKDCAVRFNGNFAFAVWESAEKKLFLARDRFGIMPLFFYRTNGGVLFSSEIKGLMKSGLIKGEVNNEGVKQLLLLGPSRSCGNGIIKGIKELCPAQFLSVGKDNFDIKTFWKPTAAIHADSKEATIERTREIITNSIQRQLSCDSTPACFLSGGLDSSIITAIAAKLYKSEGKVLNTYSVDYEGNDKYFEKNDFQSGRDNYYIDLMVDFTGSTHKYFTLSNDEVLEGLYDAAISRDLPGMADIDSSLMLLCGKVKPEHDVCMSGECSDELMAGYSWYYREDLRNRDNFPWLNSLDLKEKLFNEKILGKGNQEFVKEQYRKTVEYTDYLPKDDALNRRIREIFMLNYYWFMQTLIDRTDRMSAYSGLEVRVPYCDNELVDYAFNMPFEYKFLNGREKGIMREAFKELLPKEILERKKTPYPKTFNPKFAEYVVKTSEKLINDKSSILFELVNKEFFGELKNNMAMDSPWYGQLMRMPQLFAYLIELDIFFKTFNLNITD